MVDGVLVNKMRVLRRGARLGEESLVVTVFGMGIAGRVYMENPRFPRHIRIEAYCPRRQKVYELRVDLPELEGLVGPELVQPGRKRALCRKLLELLWLDREAERLRVAASPLGEAQAGLARRARRLEARARRLAALEAISRGANAGELRGGEAGGEADAAARARPWLRQQGLIFATATRLAGYNVVVTVHAQPRRSSTFVVRAYDTETSRAFEILCSSRELAQLMHDRRDPELWDSARRKGHCERLVLEHITLEAVAQETMALAIKGRRGLPGPGLARAEPRRGRRAALTDGSRAQQEAASVKALLQLAAQAHPYALKQSSAFGRRKAAVLRQKMPRRDIGRGVLVFRAARTLTHARRCIVSCYLAKASLRFAIFVQEPAATHNLHFAFDEVAHLCKGGEAPRLLALLLDAPAKGRTAAQLCDLLLRERIVLADTYEAEPLIDRLIYCRGHRLRDFAGAHNQHQQGRQGQGAIEEQQEQEEDASAPRLARKTALSVVTVRQGLDWIRLTAFERATCAQASLDMPADVALEIELMTPLEREIHLSAIASSLAWDDGPGGLTRVLRRVEERADDDER
jgi:hypothetical protein